MYDPQFRPLRCISMCLGLRGMLLGFSFQLVVSTLESKFRVYNMRTKHPEKGYSFLSEKVRSLPGNKGCSHFPFL